MTRILLLTASLLIVSAPCLAEVSSSRQTELMYFLKHDCGSCHGMTLKGGLGPALLPETLAGKPRALLVTTIMEGRQNTAMPPWKGMLNHDEASWITDQLLTGTVTQTEVASESTPRSTP